MPVFAATGAAAAHLVKDGNARVGFAAFGGTGGPLGGNDPLQAVGVAVNLRQNPGVVGHKSSGVEATPKSIMQADQSCGRRTGASSRRFR